MQPFNKKNVFVLQLLMWRSPFIKILQALLNRQKVKKINFRHQTRRACYINTVGLIRYLSSNKSVSITRLRQFFFLYFLQLRENIVPDLLVYISIMRFIRFIFANKKLFGILSAHSCLTAAGATIFAMLYHERPECFDGNKHFKEYLRSSIGPSTSVNSKKRLSKQEFMKQFVKCSWVTIRFYIVSTLLTRLFTKGKITMEDIKNSLIAAPAVICGTGGTLFAGQFFRKSMLETWLGRIGICLFASTVLTSRWPKKYTNFPTLVVESHTLMMCTNLILKWIYNCFGYPLRGHINNLSIAVNSISYFPEKWSHQKKYVQKSRSPVKWVSFLWIVCGLWYKEIRKHYGFFLSTLTNTV